MSVKATAKAALKPDATTGKVIGGMVLFGLIIYGIRMLPESVPASGILKKVANASTGG